jgi:hypothetical protein
MLLLLVICLGSQLDPSIRERGEAILSAYESNREALGRYGSIRFRLQSGEISNADRLPAAQLARASYQATGKGAGFLAFEGAKRRCDYLYPNPEIARWMKVTGPNQFSLKLRSFRILADDATTLLDLPGLNMDKVTELHTAKLDGPEKADQYLRSLPLALGARDPGAYDLGRALRAALRSAGEHRLDAIAIDSSLGQPLLKITLGSDNYEMKSEYWIDLERGAIPVLYRYVELEGSLHWQIVLDDLRFVGGRGWLPFRQVVFAAFLNAAEPQPSRSLQE